MYSLYFNTTVRGMAKGGLGGKEGQKGGNIFFETLVFFGTRGLCLTDTVYVILSIKNVTLDSRARIDVVGLLNLN